MNIIIENKKIINSFKYAIEGIIASFKSERNMKIHVLATIIVVILGLILKINIVEWCFCITSIVLVISAELLNTAIENIVDMISPEKNEKAKLIKDISAGAVLVLAIGTFIIGMIIFIPKIGW